MRCFLDFYNKKLQHTEAFIRGKIFGLFVFNIILMMLILMRSADYFAPFFPLSINIIVLICLVVSIPILGVRDRMLFFVSLMLWLFAALLKLLKIDVWAERTVIYSFEAMVIGMILFLISNFKRLSDRD